MATCLPPRPRSSSRLSNQPITDTTKGGFESRPFGLAECDGVEAGASQRKCTSLAATGLIVPVMSLGMDVVSSATS